MTTLAQDTFIRPDQSGLGTASDGNLWSSDRLGALSSIVSNHASIASSDGGDMAWTLGSVTAATVNISVRMQVASGAVGPIFRANLNGGFFSGYEVAIYGSSLLFVVETSATHNVVQNVVIPGFDASLFWLVRCIMTGSAYSARVWQDGTQEPSTWLFTGTDSTYPSGMYGLASNQTTAALLDTFMVSDNQPSVMPPSNAVLQVRSGVSGMLTREGTADLMVRSGVAGMEVRL